MFNVTAIRALATVFVATAVQGCDVEGASQPKSMPDVDWRLTREGVLALDAVTGKTLAEVTLPRWLWVTEQYACAPVLAKGPQGEAVVTSNVTTTLWRVDARSFEVAVEEPAGTEDNGMEFGFSGLAYSPEQGAFFAVGTVPGSLWRIDPRLRQARKIALSEPLPARCGAAPRTVMQGQARLVSLCIAGRSVNLSVDQRTGYVNGRPC
jgi:hypothetical protein